MPSRYQPDATGEKNRDARLLAEAWKTMQQDLAEAYAELDARKEHCSCRWSPKTGLSPSSECPEHGVEHNDLLNLGRAARDGGLDAEDEWSAFPAEPPLTLDELERHAQVAREQGDS